MFLGLLQAVSLAGAQDKDLLHFGKTHPFCGDEETLAELLVVNLLAHSKYLSPDLLRNFGCEFIPTDATAEVLERYPSGTIGIRIVKIRVMGPHMHPTVGYSIEVDPN